MTDQTQIAQTIPHNAEMEQAALGSIFINVAELDTALTLDMKPTDFYLHRHQWIFEAILALKEANMPVDFMTVGDQLDQAGNLKEIGGPAYLTHLINNVPTSLNAPGYFRRIKEDSERRRMIKVANGIAKRAYDYKTSPDGGKAWAVQQLNQATAGFAGAVQIGTWANYALTRIVDSENSAYYKIGFPDLDYMIGGLSSEQGNTVVLAGKAGLGKTIFTGNVAMHMQKKVPIAFYSLEMHRFRMALRLFSQLTEISAHKIRDNKIDDQEWEILHTANAQMQKLNIFASDPTWFTLPMLRADLVRLKYQHGVGGVFIDYLDLLRDTPDRYMPGPERELWLMREVTAICKEVGVFGWIIHTINASGDYSGQEKFKNVPDVMLRMTEHKAGSMEVPKTVDSTKYKLVDFHVDKAREGEHGTAKVTVRKSLSIPVFESYIATKDINYGTDYIK